MGLSRVAIGLMLVGLLVFCRHPWPAAASETGETPAPAGDTDREPRKLLKKKALPGADDEQLFNQFKSAVLDTTEWAHHFRKQDKSLTLIRHDKDRRRKADAALDTLKRISNDFTRRGLSVNDVATTRFFMHKVDATLDQAVIQCTEDSKRCGRYREDLEAVYECAVKATDIKAVIGCLGIEKEEWLF